MGKRGPAPAPTALKLVKGTRRDRVNTAGPKPAPDPNVLDPPAWLSTGAVDVWNLLAPQLVRQGVLTSWDVHAFTVLCEAIVIHERATAELADQGMTVDSSHGGRAKNPLLQIVRDSAQTIRAFAQEFGLTPSARAGIKLPEAGRGNDGKAATRFFTG
jgi:P27 family predicted phage terminase small subunit